MSPQSLYRRVWRWHFMAGLMIVPFAVILAITGAIYLFKPQYVAYEEATINARSDAGQASASAPIPADDLLTIARHLYPGSRFKALTMPRSSEDPTLELELQQGGTSRILWVDRYTSDILGERDKNEGLMSVVKRIHGTLLSGDGGSYVVELMASWMIVLIITGTYLWFPRNKGWRHVFLPFLSPRQEKAPKRLSWKHLHGSIGAWVGFMVLFLLLSGLPWTQVWGSSFKWLSAQIGQKGPGQEWFVTLQSTKPKVDGLSLWEINPKDEGAVTLHSQASETDRGPITLQRVVEITEKENMQAPVEIYPPKGENGVWTIRSMTQNRPQRVTLHLDKWTGQPVMRIDFEERPFLEKATSYGIAIHEGALFGWFNQLMGVIAALGVVFLAVSGFVMWWKRRPKGEMAVPPLPSDKRLKTGVVITIIALAVFLPLVALSLLTVLLVEALYSGLIGVKRAKV